MVACQRCQLGCTSLAVTILQQQLATALAARRAASLTAEHTAATLKQLEHRLGELSVEKNVGSGVDACVLV